MKSRIELKICPTTENVRLVGQCVNAVSTSVMETSESAGLELCVTEILNNVG